MPDRNFLTDQPKHRDSTVVNGLNQLRLELLFIGAETGGVLATERE
jgi:hypothetical protein